MNQKTKGKWMNVIYGVVLVIIGILSLLFAIKDPSVVDSVISISLAVGLFVIGVIHIASALVAHTNDFFTVSLITGCVFIAFGVILCIDRSLISLFIIYLLAAFCLALGFICTIKVVLFIVYKQKVSWIVCYIIIALILFGVGIFMFCYKDENQGKQILYGCIASLIILGGLFEIGIGLKPFIIKDKQDAEKEALKVQESQQTVVEVDSTPVEEESEEEQ